MQIDLCALLCTSFDNSSDTFSIIVVSVFLVTRMFRKIEQFFTLTSCSRLVPLQHLGLQVLLSQFKELK